MVKFFGFGAATVILGVLTASAFVEVLDMPIVYQDALSRQCVAIETAKGLETCEAGLPARYEPAFVEPGMTYKEFAHRFL